MFPETGEEIFLKQGPYGLYCQLGENSEWQGEAAPGFHTEGDQGGGGDD